MLAWLEVTTGRPSFVSRALTASNDRQAVHEQNSILAAASQWSQPNAAIRSGS